MSEEYWKIDNHKDTSPDGFKNMIRWLDRELPLEEPLGGILDAGCGAAVFSPHLARRTGHLRACDHSATQIAANCKTLPNISFFVQDLGEPIAAESKSFDAIWCAEALDRLRNPAVALNEFYRVLKPGGKLFIAVPYHGFFKNLLIALFKWNMHFAANKPHLRFFTIKLLSRLVKKSDFRNIHVETCGPSKPLRSFFIPAHILLSAQK